MNVRYIFPTVAARTLLWAAIGCCLASPLWAVAPLAPATQVGTQDEVFRVMRQDSVNNGSTNGDGTATVYMAHQFAVGQTNYLRMCLVTADHVLNGTTFGGLGFRNENPQGTFTQNAFDFRPIQSVVKLGSAGVASPFNRAGGGNDTPDIAFIGVTINLGNVGGTPPSNPITFSDATKAALLVSAANDAIPLGTANSAGGTFPAFTFNGYGVSGTAPNPA